MVSKKSLIIEQYLKMNKDIKDLIEKNIFPEFWDVIDILFYFNYNFLKPDEDVQTIDNMLEINNIDIDDDVFGSVCDIIINFLNLLRTL
jgi:hypothetical protein